MGTNETRQAVDAAVERNELRADGPSALAAQGREESAEHWAGWAEAAAARIWGQAVRCSCASPAPPAKDGRCSRCWGWPA
jgi:hypothetical protein